MSETQVNTVELLKSKNAYHGGVGVSDVNPKKISAMQRLP